MPARCVASDHRAFDHLLQERFSLEFLTLVEDTAERLVDDALPVLSQVDMDADLLRAVGSP